MRKTYFAALALALGAMITGTAQAKAHAGPHADKVDATRMALRGLWTDHVFWVRNYVVANESGDTKARDAAADQVVVNAKQIAGAIEPYYGKGASDQLLTLLAGHWGAVKGIEDATKAGKPDERKKETDALIANAKDIAKFLSGANPNLPNDTLVQLLSAHGAHHIAQIDQVHAKDFATEAKTWAAMRDHMNVIADALAEGIAKQFPEKF